MVGTIDDYHRFAKMLLGRGELGGVRLLGRKTVEYMTTNQLPGNRDLAGMGQRVFSETPFEGIGFRAGFFPWSSIRPPPTCSIRRAISAGAGRRAHTFGWIPGEQLVVVFMTQLRPLVVVSHSTRVEDGGLPGARVRGSGPVKTGPVR